MAQSGVDGWLLYDYRQSNPIFHQVLGPLSMVTRPAFLFIPVRGDAVLLVHHVDLGIYLPEFGMRSEIDVYMSESGPQVTTAMQREVVLIE